MLLRNKQHLRWTRVNTKKFDFADTDKALLYNFTAATGTDKLA